MWIVKVSVSPILVIIWSHTDTRLDYIVRHVHGFKKAPKTIYIRLFKGLVVDIGIRIPWLLKCTDCEIKERYLKVTQLRCVFDPYQSNITSKTVSSCLSIYCAVRFTTVKLLLILWYALAWRIQGLSRPAIPVELLIGVLYRGETFE